MQSFSTLLYMFFMFLFLCLPVSAGWSRPLGCGPDPSRKRGSMLNQAGSSKPPPAEHVAPEDCSVVCLRKKWLCFLVTDSSSPLGCGGVTIQHPPSAACSMKRSGCLLVDFMVEICWKNPSFFPHFFQLKEEKQEGRNFLFKEPNRPQPHPPAI